MRTAAASVEHWQERLRKAMLNCALLDRITLLDQVDSTQDEARRRQSTPGEVIVAGRQTTGRGRMGRAWRDPEGQGIAATFVIERRVVPQHLALASAVGVARAAELILGRGVGIKWPNDIIVDGRKLAGILIEQVDAVAMIGIGMNVSQMSWPSQLANRAVSLAQLGRSVDRVEALECLLPAIDWALGATHEEIMGEFARRDALTGTVAKLQCDGRAITGTVVGVDPMRGLWVETDQGRICLAAETTSVESP